MKAGLRWKGSEAAPSSATLREPWPCTQRNPGLRSAHPDAVAVVQSIVFCEQRLLCSAHVGGDGGKVAGDACRPRRRPAPTHPARVPLGTGQPAVNSPTAYTMSDMVPRPIHQMMGRLRVGGRASRGRSRLEHRSVQSLVRPTQPALKGATAAAQAAPCIPAPRPAGPPLLPASYHPVGKRSPPASLCVLTLQGRSRAARPGTRQASGRSSG